MDNTPSAPPNSSSAGNAPDIADNTPNTFAGSGIGGPPSHTIAQWMHKPAVWVAAGVVGIILLGGVSHYLVAAFRGKPPIEPPSAGSPSSATGKQSISGSTGQTGQRTPTPSATPQSSPTAAAPKNSTQPKAGGTTSGGTSNSGGTSAGNTGGGTPAPRGPIALKIMPLGDSITQGGVGGDPRTINSYRLQLWNDLGSAYQINYVGSWQNGDSQLADKDENGFSGDCIKTDPCHGDATLYSRTANWVSTEDPDLVIMQGGGNDFVDPSMTETLVETYMEDWISLVFATKPSVKIIVTGAPQWYSNYSTALQNYVNQLKTAGKPIRYVTYDNVDTVDGTHPSLAGYVTWGDALAVKVRELFP